MVELDSYSSVNQDNRSVPSPMVHVDRYLNQLHTGVDAYNRVQELQSGLIEAQGLGVLRETSVEMFGRTSCFATTTAMAINHLSGPDTFGLEGSGSRYTLGDMVEVGIRTHLNDGVAETGELLRKGYPSLDRRTGNMYHSFAKDFVHRFGIEGKVIEGFIDASLFSEALSEGAVVLLSVDNKIIPDVSLKGQGVMKLNSGRHLLFVHGNEGNNFFYTDVFNRPDADTKPMNIRVPVDILNNYLVSPAMPHINSRAVVLWNGTKPLSDGTSQQLSPFDTTVRSNPLLSFDPEADLSTYLDEMRYYQDQGLTQWTLADHLTQ